MGFLGNWKGQRAMLEHQKGNYDKALTLYAEAMEKGANKPGILIGYAVLLLRTGRYQEGVDILRKAEKAPGVTKAQKNQIITHYAVGIYKLGHLDRALELLKDQFRGTKNGILYATIGYLMIETGNFEEALAFNKEAVDYDDEDCVCLDNLGQTYYRLGNDPAAARQYFERALELKDSQIDTLYFLAKYDLEEGKTEEARAKLRKALEGRFSPLNYATQAMLEEELNALN